MTRPMWRLYGRCCMWAAKVIATVVVLGLALSLVNAKDALLPFVGLALILAVVFAWVVWAAEHILPWLRDRWHVVVAVAGLLLCVGCTRVDPGYVGIQIYYYGQHRGEPLERTAGVIWYLPGYSTVIEYPVFQRQTAWTAKKGEGRKDIDDSITYNSSEGMVFHADVSVAYTLRPHCVAEFWRRFRTDDLDAFTHGFLRQSAQNHANSEAVKYTAEQLYGEKKDLFIQSVRVMLNAEFQPLCVEIVQLGYTEAPRPPQQIAEAINAKIRATQDAIRVENELRSATAEAKKSVAAAQGRAQAVLVEAEAQAKANTLLSQSLSPQLIQQKAIDKWNGVRPTVEGSGAGLLLGLSMPPKTP